MPTRRLTPEPEAAGPRGPAAGDSARAGSRNFPDATSARSSLHILSSTRQEPSGSDHRRGGFSEPAGAAAPPVRSDGKGTLIPTSLKDEAPAPRTFGGCPLRESRA